MLGENLFGDFAALCLFMLALWLPAIIPGVGTIARSEHIVLFLSTLTRVVLCLLSASGLFLPPASDSLDFHTEATAMAAGDLPLDFSKPSSQVFTGLQSLLYSTFGSSVLLADAAGVLAFSACGVAFLSIARRVGGSRPIPLALTLFCFAPAGLLYANFNYREPFQILFLLLAAGFALSYRERARLGDLTAAALALLAFAAVHGKFFILAPLILLLTVLMPGSALGKNALKRLPGLAIGAALATVFGVWMNLSMADNDIARAVSTGAVGDYLSDLGGTASAIAARTTMPYFPSGGSSVDLLAISPLLFLQYMFAPVYPWLVTESQDLVALADTSVRIVAMIACLIALARTKKRARNPLLFLLLFFLIASFVASLGTWTVGTAMRHQIKASWALLIIAAPVLSAWARTLFATPRAATPRLATDARFVAKPWAAPPSAHAKPQTSTQSKV